MNTETVVHPRLHHLGLTTANLEPMIDWYRKVLGMTIVHRTSAATGNEAGVRPINAAWVSNDEANHRLAFVALPGLSADPDRSRHHRLQHVAFEYRTLDELLGTYLRLKELGILPVLCTDGGSQTAFYYEDPDRNSVELNVDNYGDCWTSSEHMRTSPDFAKNPIGAYVDPDKLVAAREADASPWDLHERAWAGEFAPAMPYDPRVLL
jgi:catechol 2,3-dioxygenase